MRRIYDGSSLHAGHVKKNFTLLIALVAPGSLHATGSEQFIAKVTMPRDKLKKVLLANIAGDKQAETVVTVRSVGTGGYIFAHAFSIHKQRLSFDGKVEGLPLDSGPIAALRELFKHQK